MGILEETEQSLDLASAEAPSFDPIPAGWYKCVISETEKRETSSDSPKYPDIPYLNVEFTVQDEEYEGRRLFRNYMIHEDFLGYLKQLLVASGVWTEEEVNADGFDFEADELEDAELMVRVNRKKATKGPNEGEYQNNVVRVAREGETATKAGGKKNSLLPG